jgi:hypothetical protein
VVSDSLQMLVPLSLSQSATVMVAFAKLLQLKIQILHGRLTSVVTNARDY